MSQDLTFDPVCEVRQITDTFSGNNFGPKLGNDGTGIAFGSTPDLIGGNPQGIGEIFLADDVEGTLGQITASSVFGSGWGQIFNTGQGSLLMICSAVNRLLTILYLL